jgi:hypothetical protein
VIDRTSIGGSMAKHRLRLGVAAPLLLAAALLATGSRAVEVQNLEGLDDIFGRYALQGDCKRQPQIVVDASGITFEVGGKPEKVSKLEYAVSYGGQGYEGIQKLLFPFTRTDGEYAISMHFNYAEKPGALAIEAHGKSYAGGPPFSARNAALVKGAPYARCK